MAKADEDLEAARVSGDPAEIEKAKRKEEVLSIAQSKSLWITDDNLWRYFQENKQAFE